MRDYEPEDCLNCGLPIHFMQPAETVSGGAIHRKCAADWANEQEGGSS